MEQKNTRNAANKNENSLVQVLASYLPYWPLFVIFLVMAMASAYFYLQVTVPKYEATATIIIKDEKKGYDDSKLMESLDLINTKKIIENEVEVLQSRSIMNEVVRKLHLYAPITQYGKLKPVSAYQTSPLTIERMDPDTASGYEKILLEYNMSAGTVLINKTYKGSINNWLKTPYGMLRFSPNPKYVAGALNEPFYFSIWPTNDVSSGILASLKIAPSSKLSSVINLSYRDELPKRAEDILNQLIIAYGNAALVEKNTMAKNTLAFIEDRLNVVSKDLSNIEGRLQQYKRGRGAVDISKQGQLYLENVSSNDKRLSDLNMQVAVMDQLEKSASAPGNIGVLPSTLGVSDPALITQMNNLNGLQQQYDKLKTTVAENNPLLLSINEQIKQIKPTILNNIQSQRSSLLQNRNNLTSTGGKFNSVLSSIPQKERELVEISRDQNIKNGIYSFLLQKREESELSYASTLSDSRVVNNAQSTKLPVSPNKLMIFLIAFAIALAAPIAFVTLRESFNPKILYRSEIEQLTALPIVGEIALNSPKEPILLKAGVRSSMAEEFRKIRISLLSLGINADHKKILVTSSISGEGKSFIAANLASSISFTGKKVVLVDLDLHNPGLWKFFDLKQQLGVSDYLLGNIKPDQIIYSISGNNNLFYISSGTLQADSSELLENGKIQSLIAELDANFDVVIIDTAPIVLITDAYLLSSLCDATLYVVRHQVTPKMLVKRIDENLKINPIKNAAVIFNGVKTRGFFKNNYGYGYNYTYSYENMKKKKSVFKTVSNNNA